MINRFDIRSIVRQRKTKRIAILSRQKKKRDDYITGAVRNRFIEIESAPPRL